MFHIRLFSRIQYWGGGGGGGVSVTKRYSVTSTAISNHLSEGCVIWFILVTMNILRRRRGRTWKFIVFAGYITAQHRKNTPYLRHYHRYSVTFLRNRLIQSKLSEILLLQRLNNYAEIRVVTTQAFLCWAIDITRCDLERILYLKSNLLILQQTRDVDPMLV